MFRLFLRAFGYLALAACFVSAVLDGVHSVSAGAILITSTGDVLRPYIYGIQQAFSQIHPLLWDPVIYNLLRLPFWLVLAAFGLTLFTVSIIREKPDSFAGP